MSPHLTERCGNCASWLYLHENKWHGLNHSTQCEWEWPDPTGDSVGWDLSDHVPTPAVRVLRLDGPPEVSND